MSGLYRSMSGRSVRGRGHSLTIDSGWRTVADATLEWLASKSLGAPIDATTA